MTDPLIDLKVVLPALVQKLAIYERLQKGLLTHPGLAVVRADPQGIIEEWNPGAVALFGFTRDEAVRQAVGTLIVPERYREAHSRGIARLARGQAMRGYLFNAALIPALHREGREILTRGIVIPLLDTRQALLASIALFVSASDPMPHLDAILAKAVATS